MSTALAAVALAGCYGADTGESPYAPSAIYLATLEGVVTSQETGDPLAGATVAVASGPSAGRSATTDGAGFYSIGDLKHSIAIVTASAPGYKVAGWMVRISGPTTTMEFELAAIWTASGTGNAELTKPSYANILGITATYTQRSSNFIVWCGNQLIVDERIGTDWNRTHYRAPHLTPNCTEIRIESSAGVAWTLEELQG